MSILRSNGNGLIRLRRVHRWVGATLLLFVVFLSVSGIAVNHASDFGLDRKYISWSWLLEAYGMKAPAPYAGMVSLEQLVVVGDGQRVHLLLETGELIESIDLGARLSGDIVRIGSAGDRAILDSGGILYRSNKDVTLFEPWAAGTEDQIRWSSEVDPDTAGLEVLQMAWRATTHFGRLTAGGLAVTLFAYVFINVAMVTGLVPVVGVPLPLMSYGGSAILSVMAALGLAMSPHVHGREQPRRDEIGRACHADRVDAALDEGISHRLRTRA